MGRSREESFSADGRGLEPAWLARGPSSTALSNVTSAHREIARETSSSGSTMGTERK